MKVIWSLTKDSLARSASKNSARLSKCPTSIGTSGEIGGLPIPSQTVPSSKSPSQSLGHGSRGDKASEDGAVLPALGDPTGLLVPLSGTGEPTDGEVSPRSPIFRRGLLCPTGVTDANRGTGVAGANQGTTRVSGTNRGGSKPNGTAVVNNSPSKELGVGVGSVSERLNLQVSFRRSAGDLSLIHI